MGPQLSSSPSSSSSPTLAPSLSPVASSSSTTINSLTLTDDQAVHQTSNTNSYSNHNPSDSIDSSTSRNNSSSSGINNNNSFQYHQQYEDNNMRTNCYLANRNICQSTDLMHHHNQYQSTTDSYYNHCCQTCNQSQPCKCLDHHLQDPSSMAQSEMFHFERTQAHQIPLISTSNDNLGYQKKEYQTLNSINDSHQQQHQPPSTYDQYQMQPRQERKHQMLDHEDNQILISDSRNQTNDSLTNNNQVAYNTGYSDTNESKTSSSSCNMNNWTVTHDSCSSRTMSLNDTTYDNLLFHDVLNHEDKQGTKILHQRQQQQQKITPNDFNNNQQHNFSMLLNNQNLPQVQEASRCLSSQQQADSQQHLADQNVVSNTGFYISTSSEDFLTPGQNSREQYTLNNYGQPHLEHDSSLIKDQSNELQKSSLPLNSEGVQQSNNHNAFSSYDHIPQHNNHFQCQDSIEENYLKHQTFDNLLFPDTNNQHNTQQQQLQYPNQRLYQPVQLQILDRQSNKPTCDSVLMDRQQQQQQEPQQQHLRQQHISTIPRDNQYAFEEEYPAFHQLAINCDNYNNQVSTTTVSHETNQSSNKIRTFKGRRGRPRKKGPRSKSKFVMKIYQIMRRKLCSN